MGVGDERMGGEKGDGDKKDGGSEKGTNSENTQLHLPPYNASNFLRVVLPLTYGHHGYVWVTFSVSGARKSEWRRVRGGVL